MQEFKYTIKDDLGIHARPAGLLAKLAKEYSSKITVSKGDKSADATKLIALMGMGVKKNDEVTIRIDGADADAAKAALKSFFEKNL